MVFSKNEIKNDAIAMMGEFVGTTMFIFLGVGGIKTSINSQTFTQSQTLATLSTETILFISVSMGLSLLVNAWVFYRITGGLFNPAVTFSLWLIGGVHTFRAILLTIAQIAGGIAGSGLIALLTPVGAGGGIETTITKLEPGINKGQGLMLEAFLTAMLVFTVLMLAAEKHKATFMAPIGIGLTLFVCQLFGTLWTGCGMNPARALGPCVIAAQFPGYHWIYWAGPYIGSLIATGFYFLLKAFDYGSVVLGQDSDSAGSSAPPSVGARLKNHGFTFHQRKAMLKSGMRPEDLERAEAAVVADATGQQVSQDYPGHTAHAGGRHPSRASDATVTDRANGQYSEKGPGMYLKPGSGQSTGGMATQATPPTARRTTSTRNQSYRGNGTSHAPLEEQTSMTADNQDEGGVGVPGSQPSGLANIPIVGKIMGQRHANANR